MGFINTKAIEEQEEDVEVPEWTPSNIVLPSLAFPDTDDTWRDVGLCRNTAVNFFDARRTTEAKNLCMECPSIEPCRAFALRNKEEWGVWGGLDSEERRALRKAGHGA